MCFLCLFVAMFCSMKGFRYVPEVIERADEEALVAHVRDLASR